MELTNPKYQSTAIDLAHEEGVEIKRVAERLLDPKLPGVYHARISDRMVMLNFHKVREWVPWVENEWQNRLDGELWKIADYDEGTGLLLLVIP